jgi:hypothetical protein
MRTYGRKAKLSGQVPHLSGVERLMSTLTNIGVVPDDFYGD